MLADLVWGEVLPSLAGDEDEVGDVVHISVVLPHSLLQGEGTSTLL